MSKSDTSRRSILLHARDQRITSEALGRMTSGRVNSKAIEAEISCRLWSDLEESLITERQACRVTQNRSENLEDVLNLMGSKGLWDSERELWIAISLDLGVRHCFFENFLTRALVRDMTGFLHDGFFAFDARTQECVAFDVVEDDAVLGSFFEIETFVLPKRLVYL